MIISAVMCDIVETVIMVICHHSRDLNEKVAYDGVS